ncbi:hypothetical protein [Anaeromicropila populeti]|uniref:AraC family transcriptional regulator, arabinose operon regulatory protein n=1 Tax=Anaeromicropila populeti TaxID=37658 RepID=A0A1I6KC65_9FIRM|nr:hypothetical protein [Anaeromicropila populeti]SFR88460.1 AraC family transcriptional regulator, arabinose operon regulatory protein [Anaeromicropila populeti]
MIKVNIGGCNNHHPQNFMISQKKGSNDYLLLVTKSETSFAINGVSYQTPSGTFVLFDAVCNVNWSHCRNLWI